MGFKLLSFTLPILFETMVYTGQDKYNRNIFVMINNLLKISRKVDMTHFLVV